MKTVLAAFVVAISAVSAPQDQASRFAASTSMVIVGAAVLKGNVPVVGLTVSDFALSDSGVNQLIERVESETVPLDVTLFLDTSGSTAAHLPSMRKDLTSIVRTLRPMDRFRLLTIGDSVIEPISWVSPDPGFDLENRLDLLPVPGISLVYDAIAAALMYRPAPGRRHLIVAITDRMDGGSVVPSGLVLELAGRTDAVLHIVEKTGSSPERERRRIRGFVVDHREDGPDKLRQAAERTGGALVNDWVGGSALREFSAIYGTTRQSYVLYYSPKGVRRGGWHPIVVTTKGLTGVRLRFRQGYFD